ncbi:uncharacterized protein SCHCODRAFT_02672889 [Schizophyllum commune H4-8]|uniref:Expressed protein n=1 Tax=Schizophyllum commune (strain H4-8 / FGSC 9210) TaxID=578458 RepID=D8QJ27_SCHCM|nr:uncharacterized protein SCHCODRAFT_02672889 [Schizophyllum commune H4-8]KAI5885800.1 hypothetical protein SCHCODRAFT_02672889 [Schizophyllum commune H4-8]
MRTSIGLEDTFLPSPVACLPSSVAVYQHRLRTYHRPSLPPIVDRAPPIIGHLPTSVGYSSPHEFGFGFGATY